MAADTLFITEVYFKEFTIVNENVDVKLIRPAIIEAQNIHIQSAIGTGLFNELKTQIAGNSLTALNTTLLEQYVQPCLIKWAMYEICDAILYKFMNKSIVTKNSENSTSIDKDALNYLRSTLKNKAQWYTERLNSYLIENSASYPLFANPGSGSDVIHAKKDSYTTNMFLEDCEYCEKRSYKDKYQGNNPTCF